MRPSLGFVGAGSVGGTLARLWQRAGYPVTAVSSRTEAHALALAQAIGAEAVASPEEAMQACEVLFLTVPDDAIAPVAAQLAGADLRGKAVVHTAGAASLDKLRVPAQQGASVGSLHPAFPFADVETSLQTLPGASFALEASDLALQGRLIDLAEALHGKVLLIPPGGKAAYHAAMVIASNYTVTLYATAEALLQELGAEQEAISNALNAIVGATVQNLKAQGIPDALTGPLTRADVGTIQAHLAALPDDLRRQTYMNLARLSFPMLRKRGVDVHAIEAILQDES